MASIDLYEDVAYQALIKAFPEWEQFSDASEITYSEDYHYAPYAGRTIRFHVFSVPSPNPRVFVPLKIETYPEPALYWHRGYFYDFPYFDEGMEGWTDRIVGFLRGWLNEEVVLTVSMKGDCPSSGGPQLTGWNPQMVGPALYPDFATTEVRSWLGTYDADWQFSDGVWSVRPFD